MKVIVDVIGGPWEGTYQGDASHWKGKSYDPRGWVQAKECQLGAVMQTPSPLAAGQELFGQSSEEQGARRHKYVVVGHEETADTLHAKLQYQGIVKKQGDQ